MEALMNALPLHPAIVHLPLGLAILMPLFAAGVAWALWTGRVGHRGWMVVVALQALLLGAALVAIKTGGAEEDRVERVVQESVLHRHEELAEQFAWAAGATLGLAALVLVLRRPVAERATSVAVVAATLVVAGLGLRVGHAGGELVYVHGAASAYTSSGRSGTFVSPDRSITPAGKAVADDDDHRRRR
jgi:uncharacterized membrane protein